MSRNGTLLNKNDLLDFVTEIRDRQSSALDEEYIAIPDDVNLSVVPEEAFTLGCEWQLDRILSDIVTGRFDVPVKYINEHEVTASLTEGHKTFMAGDGPEESDKIALRVKDEDESSSETTEMPNINEGLLAKTAGWLIDEGTENTGSGNYIAEFSEVAKAFNVDEKSVAENADAIMGIIAVDGSVADVDIIDKTFDINFYLDYCKNLEPESYRICYPYLDEYVAIPHENARTLDCIVKYIFDSEYPGGESEGEIYMKARYVRDIESYGVSLGDICKDPGLWPRFQDNALRHLKYICGLDDAQLDDLISGGEFQPERTESKEGFEPVMG
jgi:hypothetical protein